MHLNASKPYENFNFLFNNSPLNETNSMSLIPILLCYTSVQLNAFAPDFFHSRGEKKNQTKCIWVFSLLSYIKKFIKMSGTYQPVGFTFQKPKSCIKAQKSLWLSIILLPVRVWFLPRLLSRIEHLICMTIFYSNKPCNKIWDSWYQELKRKWGKYAVEMFGFLYFPLPTESIGSYCSFGILFYELIWIGSR